MIMVAVYLHDLSTRFSHRSFLVSCRLIDSNAKSLAVSYFRPNLFQIPLHPVDNASDLSHDHPHSLVFLIGSVGVLSGRPG